jgi:hypothetical protein
MFLPAFGTFPSVVSGFVMSHKLARQTERQASKMGGASETWRILYWRQIVSAMALIIFGQERYHVSALPPRQWLGPVAGDILPGLE